MFLRLLFPPPPTTPRVGKAKRFSGGLLTFAQDPVERPEAASVFCCFEMLCNNSPTTGATTGLVLLLALVGMHL